MRETLHRGKRKDTGEWVYGGLVIANDPINAGKRFILQSTSDFSYGGDQGERIRIGCFVEIDPETTGEHTELTDMNGKKIFEGDIIENFDFNAENGGYGVVEYHDGAFEVNGNDISGTFHENYWGKECEVIGNIHDNPEFLGGEGRCG